MAAYSVIILLLTGVLTVPLSEAWKRATKAKGMLALIFVMLIAWLLTVTAIFLTGFTSIESLSSVAGATAITFSISQIIFKAILADKKPDNTVDPNSLR